MHELAIAQGLLKVIREELKRHQLCHVTTIKLKIGELTSIVPETLDFCFSILVKDTELEGVSLEIDKVPVKGRCLGCKREFNYKNQDFYFLCPYCGSEIEIINGRELYIQEIEGEQDGQNTCSEEYTRGK